MDYNSIFQREDAKTDLANIILWIVLFKKKKKLYKLITDCLSSIVLNTTNAFKIGNSLS